jgi:hypothetical protein
VKKPFKQIALIHTSLIDNTLIPKWLFDSPESRDRHAGLSVMAGERQIPNLSFVKEFACGNEENVLQEDGFNFRLHCLIPLGIVPLLPLSRFCSGAHVRVLWADFADLP